jgi:ABC-type uncharacterized transport system substrate-binding protein
MDGVTLQFLRRRICKSHLLRSALLLCLLLTSSISQASILLLLSSDVSYYQETANSVLETASNLGISDNQFVVLTIKESQDKKALSSPYELIVAIGTSAASEALLYESETPLLNIFTPKDAVDSIQIAEEQKEQRQVSAIYLDQPLERLITLACLLKPKADQFGTIFGPISKHAQPEIERLTKESNIHLEYDFLTKDDNPVAVLKPIVASSELFIAIPDHAILNRAIAKWILYLSFQHKIPVIGFSKAYTNAGALASVYSSPQNIGQHAGELIAAWLKNNDQAIWNPQFPRYFTLSTNPAVARSLGISLPQESNLYLEFQQKEAMKYGQ